MKTRSKIRIAGTLIPCAARSFARSSRNGCGTSGWNWGRSSLRQIYAQPNLPKPVSSSLSRELHPFPLSILAAWRSTRYRFSMVLPNGHVLLLREAFPVLLLLHSRMGRCVVPPTIHCIHKNGAPPRDGSLRVLYAARIGHCRTCPLRAQCQESNTTIKPRRVSAVLWPLSSLATSSPTPTDAPAPLPVAPVLVARLATLSHPTGMVEGHTP